MLQFSLVFQLRKVNTLAQVLNLFGQEKPLHSLTGSQDVLLIIHPLRANN